MWINEIKLIVIISWLPLLLLAIFARYYSRSWFSPMASWAGYWALIIFIAFIVPIDYKYSPKAILVIGLFVLAFIVGGMPFNYRRKHSNISKGMKTPTLKMRSFIYAKAFIGVGLICAIAICFIYLFSVGLSLNTIRYQMTLIYTAPHDVSYMRYYDENPYSLWINLFSIPVFASALLAGFIYPISNGISNKIFYLCVPLVSASLITLVSTAKMNLLVMVFFFLAAYVTSLLIFKNQHKNNKIAIIMLITLSSITIIIFFISLILRYQSNLSNIDVIIGRFIDSFSGFLASFSAWIEQYFGGVNERIDYWGFTFQWIRHFIEIGERQQGLFPPIINYSGFGSPSNIFTLYRCLIEDFTLPGALILSCISSYLFSNAYFNILAERIKVVHWGIMLFYYPCLLYSFVFLVYGYSTCLAAWLLACFLIKIIVFNTDTKDTIRSQTALVT